MLNDYLSARSLGEYTELRAQQNSARQVRLLAGNMTTNTQMVTGGVSARVYKGGTFGFASGAEYTEESVGSVLRAATENAEFMDSHVNKGLPPLPGSPAKADMGVKPGENVPQSVIIDYAKAVDDAIKEKYKGLTSRSVSVGCLGIEKFLVVSDGSESRFFQPRTIIYISMTAETPDGIPVDLYYPFGGFGRFDDLFKDPKSHMEEIDKLYEDLMMKREGVFSEAGTKKCVLGPELAGILAHEAVGHTVEADLVLGGSVAGHNLEKQVASELVTMIDFAHTALGKKCPLPVYMDDEGVAASDVTLIENGILKNFMHSKETARHFGVEPRGNARAFTFSDEPLIRMRNTAILPGKDKLGDMISGIDDGYYLLKTGNGQADTTGEFMFSVELGYEIKKGKIGKAIRETTISGVAFEMLKTVDMVSDDMFWECSGFCGKKQPMTVGMGGPALRCEVNIGGR